MNINGLCCVIKALFEKKKKERRWVGGARVRWVRVIEYKKKKKILNGLERIRTRIDQNVFV